MARIKLPVVPRSAYDPKRPANALLQAHVVELEKSLVASGRGVRRKKPKSEEQVAAYIRHLNRALHQQVLLPPMKRRPLDVPLDHLTGGAPKRSARSPSRKRGATRAAPRKQRSQTRTRKRRRS